MGKESIKFQCCWEKLTSLNLNQDFSELLSLRNELHKFGLIGVDEDNIGYGNISQRLTFSDNFLISGSGSGSIKNLGISGYSLVLLANIDQNMINCCGPCKASSESLTHAAAYLSDPEIQVVLHIHNQKLWNNNYHTMCSTPSDCEYGTVALAKKVKELIMINKGKINSILLKGHQDGLLIFGKSHQEVSSEVLKLMF